MIFVEKTVQKDLFESDKDTSETIGYIAGEKLDPLCSEERAYEYFCDIADTLIGAPIAAVARFEAPHPERSSLFRSRIRAIYRASVWGQFSLLCEGISTPDELTECSSILKEVFCELEGEGREFNGFIEKGICIDTPMILYNTPHHPRFDFFCFDFKKLLYLCTGIRDSTVGANALASYIIKICASSREREIAIKAYTNNELQEISEALYPINIKKRFFFSGND